MTEGPGGEEQLVLWGRQIHPGGIARSPGPTHRTLRLCQPPDLQVEMGAASLCAPGLADILPCSSDFFFHGHSLPSQLLSSVTQEMMDKWTGSTARRPVSSGKAATLLTANLGEPPRPSHPAIRREASRPAFRLTDGVKGNPGRGHSLLC